MFTKIGLAVSFSPTGKALLCEAKRLSDLTNADLLLIHNGNKTTETEIRLDDMINSVGIEKSKIIIDWVSGEIADSIIKSAEKNNVDLLLAGALEKENLIKKYFGSVARKLMRQAKCSVLILISPSENPQKFNKIYVSTDFSSDGERTIKLAHSFALLQNAKEFVLLREFNAPGLAYTLQDSTTIADVEELRNQWLLDEEIKMNFFIKELNLPILEPKIVCLFGKEGWEASNYAKTNKADLFVVHQPNQKITFFDKLFPHEVDYSFINIPTNLFIIR